MNEQFSTLSMKYRMIVLDMDGTLLTSEKTIDLATEASLKKRISSGIHVTLASGRFPASVWLHARYLQSPSPQISLNGSVIVDGITGAVLKSFRFTKGELDVLINIVNSFPTRIQFYSNNVLYVSKFSEDNRYWPIQNVVRNPNLILNNDNYRLQANLMHVCEIGEYWSVLDDWSIPIYKATVFSERESLEFVYQHLLQAGFSVSYTGLHRLDINPPGINKAVAISHVCTYLKMALQEVVAFGDGDNDVEMLKSVGLGVAMGNASDSALSAAKLMTRTNDETGIAHMLEQVMAARSMNRGEQRREHQ